MSEAEARNETVSRRAYFGGIAVGGIVLASGLYGVSMLDAGGWSIPLEMAVVMFAMLVTTRIWKRSAGDGRQELDSPSGQNDGR